MAERPNFKVNTPAIDPMAFASVLQRKRAAEDQNAQEEQRRKDERLTRVLQAVQGGQQIANSMMANAEKKQKLKAAEQQVQAQNELASLVGSPEPQMPSPTVSSTAGASQGNPLGTDIPVMPSPEQMKGFEDSKAERTRRLNAALFKVNPEQFSKEMAQARFPNSTALQDRFQQSTMQYRDKAGQLVTVATTFDKTSGQQLNPLTREAISSPEALEGLVEKGYAQELKPAGFSLDGTEIVRDRKGAKFTSSFDESGTPILTPYEGPAYPRLENPPAKFTEAVAEFGNAKIVLKDIATSFDPNFVGPVAARAGKMSKFVGSLTDEQQVKFYGNVAEYKNSIIKAITGAQMSETEAKRIVQQIPDENAAPKAFLAGLQRAYVMTDRRLKQMEMAVKRSGGVVRGEDESPISEEELQNLINEKLGKFDKPEVKESKENKSGLPSVGQTYNGGKVLKVTRVK